MEEQELKQELVTVENRVDEIMVLDKETFSIAGEMVIEIDQLIKKIKLYWKEPKERAFQAHRAITAKEAEMLKPAEDRRKALTQKINTYSTEQRRLERIAQEKLDAERRAAEQKERERIERQAAKAEEKGNIEKAEALKEKAEAVYIPPAIVEPVVEKTTRMESGTVSQVKDIEITITDEKAIIAAVASGKLPMTIVTINEAKLKKYLKDFDFKTFDGVEIREVVNTKFRGK